MKLFKRKNHTMAPAAFLLTVLLLLCGMPMVFAQAQDEAVVYDLSDQAVLDQIKVQGRSEVVENGLAVHTIGAGIAFYSECSGDVTLTLTTRNNWMNRQYFTVTVDGERTRKCVDNKSNSLTRQTTIKLASGLEQGLHRIEIYRQTEEVNASCIFETLQVNGDLRPLPQAPMLIEFVGDSLTCGASMVPPSSKYPQADDPANSDGTRSYGWKTAEALGMDFQACCTSGYGVVRGWNTDGVNLREMYPYTAYHHNHQGEDALWSFARPADIVVINLGSNDHSKGVDADEFKEGATEMMLLVREKNPDAAIVWATGLAGVFYETQLQSMIEELGGAQAGYYYCELPMGVSGGAGHPNREQHAAAAETLTAFLLETVLPEGYADSLVDASQMEALLDKSSGNGDAYRIAQLEYQSFLENEGSSVATLTAAYETLQESGGLSMTAIIVIAGAFCVLVIVGAVLFAVLYKPKTPRTPPSE